jgi:hypothetical protein
VSVRAGVFAVTLGWVVAEDAAETADSGVSSVRIGVAVAGLASGPAMPAYSVREPT